MHLFKVLTSKEYTQRQLNKLYEAPDFFLAKRLATMTTIITMTFGYFTNLPLILLLSSIYFLTSYVADKYTLLRISRRPRMIGIKIIKKTHSLYFWAIVCYVGNIGSTFGFNSIYYYWIGLVFLIIIYLLYNFNIWLPRKIESDSKRVLTKDSPELNIYIVPNPSADQELIFAGD